MKAFLLTLTLAALLVPQGQAFILVSISGTASHGVEDGYKYRIINERLSNRRIYEEFGVSPKDYALVLDENLYGFLLLIPRRANSNMSPIYVMHDLAGLRLSLPRGANGTLTELPLTNTATQNNMFTGFRGTALGPITAHHRPNYFTVSGHFDVLGSSPSHLFRIKIRLRPGRMFFPEP